MGGACVDGVWGIVLADVVTGVIEVMGEGCRVE